MYSGPYKEFSAPLTDKSSVTLIDYKTHLLFNRGMDTIEDTRRKRLLILIAEYRTASALSKATDVDETQISQWKNKSPDSKTGRPRTMDSDSARHIESKTNKPRGWMDQPIEITDNEKVSLSVFGLKREDIDLDLIEYINLYKKSAKEDQEESKNILAHGTDSDKVNRKALLADGLVLSLKLLHPFMPFVTEAVWQHMPKNL